MKHTKSLLQTEIFRMQKAFDKLDKSGQNIALADYFLELKTMERWVLVF